MPAQYKLNQALKSLNNRGQIYVAMDIITSILQGLIGDGEYVKDWTTQEIVEFVQMIEGSY